MKTPIYLDLKKIFTSKDGSYSVDRAYFCDLPCGMIAEEFSDDRMQDFVDYVAKAIDAEFTNDELELLRKFREPYISDEYKSLTQDEICRADDLNAAEFEMIETIAREWGMLYYEDLTDESYQSIMDAYDNHLTEYDKELQ